MVSEWCGQCKIQIKTFTFNLTASPVRTLARFCFWRASNLLKLDLCGEEKINK